MIAPLVVAACAAGPAGTFVLPSPSGDALTDSALLLAAGEAAPDAAARAPVLARLDAAGVRPLPDAGDDPLGQWRREAAAAGTGEVYRGRALGPAYRRARLAPGETVRLEQIFLAGERAEIAAAANGGTALTLSVRDRKDAAVCSAPFAPAARCRWLPMFTERYAIELANNGKAAASVYLVFK
ncbi:hypothetical protein [Tsuneonella sp. HG222]